MASFNKVILLGNLTRDPELRVTPKGTSVANYGLAVNERFKDESGQPQEKVVFVDVVSFGKIAEVVAKYCSKGSPVMIDGRLTQNTWEDKQTKQKRSKIEIIAEVVQFLGSPKRESVSNPSGYEQQDNPTYAPPPHRQASAQDKPDEDVPF